MSNTNSAPNNLDWLITGDVPCLQCNYNIRGCIGPIVKCPECGHANDLRNPAPWKEASLPLGVKQREHWPALAPAFSFVVALILWIAYALASHWYHVELANYGFILTSAALYLGIPGFFSLIASLLWLRLCIKWLNSTKWSRHALTILATSHFSAWAIFFGIVLVPYRYFLASHKPTFDLWVPIPFLTLFPLGCFLIFWTRKQINAKKQSKLTFREDWATWSLPINDLVSQPDTSADQPSP